MGNEKDKMGTTPVRIDDGIVEMVRSNKDKTGFPIGRFIEDAIMEKLDGGIFGKIKRDEGLYYAFQANIAMAVKDEFSRWKKKKKFISNTDMHEIANTAAKYFLDLMIKEK